MEEAAEAEKVVEEAAEEAEEAAEEEEEEEAAEEAAAVPSGRRPCTCSTTVCRRPRGGRWRQPTRTRAG